MSAACGFPIGPEFHRYVLMNSMHPVPFFRNLPSQYNNFYLTAKGAAVPPPQNGRWSQYSLLWRLLPPSWPLLTFTPVFPVGSNIKFSCQRDQAGPPLCLFGISGDSLPLGSLGRSGGLLLFLSLPIGCKPPCFLYCCRGVCSCRPRRQTLIHCGASCYLTESGLARG